MDKYYYPTQRDDAPKVLKNKQTITDPHFARLNERGKTQERADELYDNHLAEFSPGYAGLNSVHYYLFQDVYDWAGRSRALQVTIDGETFTPAPQRGYHKVVEGKVVASFAPNSNLEAETSKLMQPHIDALEGLRLKGQITPASLTPLRHV